MTARDLKGAAGRHPFSTPGSARQNRQAAGFEADQSQSQSPAGSASTWGGELPPHDPAQAVQGLDSPADDVQGLDATPEGASQNTTPHLRYGDVGQPTQLPSPAVLWRYLKELDSLINFHPKTVAVPPRQSVGWRGDLIKPPKE